MSMHDEVAHRHLLAADGLDITPSGEAQIVRIVIGDGWSDSRAGQLMASCLVNLLVRQVKLVRQIEIVASAGPRLIHMPHGSTSEDFPACLMAMGPWATDAAVPISVNGRRTRVHQTIFIGSPPEQTDPADGRAFCLLGDGWRAWVGTPEHTPRGVLPISRNALGPFLAAALSAGEIFKVSRGIRRGRYLTAGGYSLWSTETSPDWRTLADGPEIAGSALPPIHLPGVGAVGNALAYIMANLELAQAYLVLIDDDRYDKTSLNRCLLAGWSDRNQPKVDAVARAMRAAGIGAFPFAGTIKSYLGHARVGLRADAAREADDLDFNIVASCVDKGVSRQDVQGLWPRLLLGGSTLNLQAKCNLYNARPGAACLGCFNPAERDGEKIRALKDEILNLSLEERRRYLIGHGLDAKGVEDYLSGTTCGGLAEAAFKDFATRPPAQFSAGFTSLGAGLLLGAALLRTSLFEGIAPSSSDMTTLNFLNGGLLGTPFAADAMCELRCRERR